MKKSTLAVISLTSLLAAAASAQAFQWSSLPGPGRRNHAMATDTARGRVVMFGGADNSGWLADTLEWNGGQWVQRNPFPFPPARANHAMAYDAARQRVVMFGGYKLADTWEWNGTAWTGQLTPVSPSARSGHAMAYDAARQRVVMFGGTQYGGAVLATTTWEWDGTTWTEHLAAPPPPRVTAAMAYDAARQRVVLFGGHNLLTALGDTWEWNGTSWTQRTPPASPSPRAGAGMAFDVSSQRVVLFGGVQATGAGNDTWQWDGTSWLQLTPSPTPFPSVGHAAASLPGISGGIVVTGGEYVPPFGPSSLLQYTWIGSSAAVVPAIAANYGNSCAVGSPLMAFVPDPFRRPVLGQSARIDLANAPTNVALVAAGDYQFVSLAGAGLTGCSLYQTMQIVGLGLTPTSNALRFEVTIPTSPSLLHVSYYLQAAALAPGANPAQLVTSNGVQWRLGNL